jgi:hypothetical protein
MKSSKICKKQIFSVHKRGIKSIDIAFFIVQAGAPLAFRRLWQLH